jgi:hypothetical protein
MVKPLPILVGAVLALGTVGTADRQHGGGNSTRVGDRVDECRDIKVRFSDLEMVTAEEEFTIGGSSLQIVSPHNGGVWLIGSERSDFGVTACLAGAGRTAQAAGQVLKAIKVDRSGGRLTATGSDEGRWMVHLIVHAPRGRTVGIETRNGPIELRDVDGKYDVHATNGPVAIHGAGGVINVRTTNGPISVNGGSGDVTVRAENGPVDVRLSGTAWKGKGLEGSVENGPLSVKVPASYASGVVIERNGHGPFDCRGCVGRLNDRRIEFGDGPPVVRISAGNGPVSITRRD